MTFQNRLRSLLQVNLLFPLLAFALWGAVLFIPQEMWAEWGTDIYKFVFPNCSLEQSCPARFTTHWSIDVHTLDGYALLVSLVIFFPFSLLASYGFSFFVPKTSRHWFVLEMILIHLLGVAFALYTFPVPAPLGSWLLYWPFLDFPPPHFLRGFWGAIIISLYALGRALSYRYFLVASSENRTPQDCIIETSNSASSEALNPVNGHR